MTENPEKTPAVALCGTEVKPGVDVAAMIEMQRAEQERLAALGPGECPPGTAGIDFSPGQITAAREAMNDLEIGSPEWVEIYERLKHPQPEYNIRRPKAS